MNEQVRRSVSIAEELSDFYSDIDGADPLKSTIKHFAKLCPATPIFDANIASLGLLGASLAADVITVASAANPLNGIPTEMIDGVTKKEVLNDIFIATLLSMTDWAEDLAHVSNRLGAVETGSRDTDDLSTIRRRRESRERKQHLKEFSEILRQLSKGEHQTEAPAD